MVLIAARQSATVLLWMVIALMASRDERLPVQIIRCLIVSSSRELQASRVVLALPDILSGSRRAGERLLGGVCDSSFDRSVSQVM